MICYQHDLPEIHGTISEHEPMARHTSYRIGGPADLFAVPDDASDLQLLLRWAREKSVPSFILGAGTNLLVADKGIRGLVIKFGCGFENIHIQGEKIVAGAGVRLPVLVKTSLRESLAGLEGLTGVPGTVGGSICMNAGTPQGCMKDTLQSVKVLDKDLNLRQISVDELGLRYRGSSVVEQGIIILEATFVLNHQAIEGIQEIADSLLSKRKAAQPVKAWTAGSVFKNPAGGYAGKLLDDIGAKGMRIGGARVSDKHANFIENTGEASALDVRNLVCELQRLVNEKFGVVLEPEIAFVGEW